MSPLPSADASSALWLAMPSITLWDPPQSPSDSRAQPQIDGLKNSKTLCAYVWMPVCVHMCTHLCICVHAVLGTRPRTLREQLVLGPKSLALQLAADHSAASFAMSIKGGGHSATDFPPDATKSPCRCQADMYLCSDLCSLASTSSSTGPSGLLRSYLVCREQSSRFIQHGQMRGAQNQGTGGLSIGSQAGPEWFGVAG